MTLPSVAAPADRWRLFVPKSISILRRGYGFTLLRQDAVAGLTVAIVALPLAMALAIASGATPEKGLITAIVAGFLISALGGSRVQIGGPTGAFVVVVFNVIQNHGYNGLILATFMASGMLIAAGFARLGTWIKYIPEPVITGFTAGIAVIIFSSQVKDLLGLSMASVPAEMAEKWVAYAGVLDTIDIMTVLVAALSLGIIVVLRRFLPKAPGFLFAVVVAASIVAILDLPVETIGSRFGALPHYLPVPALPNDVTWQRLADLLPSAFTIAFLAGVESLLSAVVADGMTGGRHRSNCELVAQGIANAASALFGGLPATGAIARTATNIRSGAKSPVAGMIHAACLMVFMFFLSPLASAIPLAGLAAILVVVAWNMSEFERFRYLLSAPWEDKIVLLSTFFLTVFVDLTVAIEVGVVLAAILFMHRMARVAAIGMGAQIIEIDRDDLDVELNNVQRTDLPSGVEVFQFRGPLFFGVAGLVSDMVDHVGSTPKIMILRMREVPLIDATGAGKLMELTEHLRRRGISIIISGLQPQPQKILTEMRVIPKTGLYCVENFASALKSARELLYSKI